MEVHYCLGQIKDVNYAFFDTACCCDDSGESMSKGCCNEETYFVQIKDEHQSAAEQKISVVPAVGIAMLQTPLEEDESIAPKFFLITDSGPPRTLYQDHCSLIFYA